MYVSSSFLKPTVKLIVTVADLFLKNVTGTPNWQIKEALIQSKIWNLFHFVEYFV